MIHEATTIHQPPPWMLANLLSSTNSNCGSSGEDDSPLQTSTSTSSLLQQILPGPFTVLQGSPGDGMSNTLDSMPMLPLDSMTKNNEEAESDNNISSNQSQHRRCSSMSLHPLEEVADEEEEGNDGSGGTAINESAANTRPRTPLDNNDDGEGNNNNSIIGRERSDSLTGGGLHYPLGEKSPIMQRRVCRPSLTSNFMQQQTSSFSSPSITSTSAQATTETTPDGSNEVPLMPGDEGTSNNSSICNDDTPTILQRRRQQDSAIISSSSSINHENQQSQQPSPYTPSEISSIFKWANEVTQQTKMHLDERNQNVKLLLDRRKRSSLQLQQQRQRQREVEQQQQLQHHADEIATATSASDSTVDDDESGRIISRSPSPMLLSTPPSSSSPTTSSPPHELQPQLQPSTTIEDEHINSFELEISHRSWYQKDGRLIVFKSLPVMDLPSGKVVTDPIVKGSKDGRMGAAEGRNVVTIAPGSTVMAEEAITLDSRSLKIIHSTANQAAYSNDDDDDERRSHRSSSSGATLCFLNITSPYAGYILSHIHNYPYLAPGLPTTYTNSTWLWRVTCHPDGAFIRSGLDLVTDHIGTLPYGSFCSVEKKVVNYMG